MAFQARVVASMIRMSKLGASKPAAAAAAAAAELPAMLAMGAGQGAPGQ